MASKKDQELASLVADEVTRRLDEKAGKPVQMLTKTEVQRLLHCSDKTIDRSIRKGLFPPAVITPGGPRWPATEVAAWQRKRMAERECAA